MEPLQFILNGEHTSVLDKYEATYTLAEYLREVAGLKGTKVNCREGGCGVCVVTATFHDHTLNKQVTKAINSCLCPLYGIHGWHITTVEGLGGKRTGYHPIQKLLAERHATQCGFCTPGIVMSIYGSLQEGKPTERSLECALDGNLCRCTGYRSILDAAMSLTDPAQCADIEDLRRPLVCSRTGAPCHQLVVPPSGYLEFPSKTAKWYKAFTVEGILTLMDQHGQNRVQLVVGNTANGIFKTWSDVYIDIKDVKEMYSINKMQEYVEVGASVSLSTLIEQCVEWGKMNPGLEYCSVVLAPHLRTIAGTPVRNVGCWAGNLMLQHLHPAFPSDLAPALHALAATLTIRNSVGLSTCTITEFLEMNMNKQLITSVKLPVLTDKSFFKIYKVQPRRADAHAYVTGAFYCECTVTNNQCVVNNARIVFSGLHSTMVVAASAEAKLNGLKRLTQESVTECLHALQNDLSLSDMGPLAPSVTYRTQVAVNILYKYLLNVSVRFGTPSPLVGSLTLTDPGLRQGSQTYQELPDNFPLNQALSKVEALPQASGEAQFTDDIPHVDKELFAVVVPSQHAIGSIVEIVTSKAKALPGVFAIYTAHDIPGENFETAPDVPLLAKDKVVYAGQAVAIVVADTERTARQAGRLVEIKLSDVRPAVTDINEAISKGMISDMKFQPASRGNAKGVLLSCDHVLEGTYSLPGQYHFPLENHVSVAYPTESGMEVWTSSQFPTKEQSNISCVLGLPANNIDVNTRRIGGGFGGKIFTPHAALCALAAYLSNRPVRYSLSLKNNIESCGMRYAYAAHYKVGYSTSGQVQALVLRVYHDHGCGTNPVVGFHTKHLMGAINQADCAYNIKHMYVEGYSVRTDVMYRTPFRAPERLQSTIFMEALMEKIAWNLKMDPWQLKQQNMYKPGQMALIGYAVQSAHERVVAETLKMTELDTRLVEIEQFNMNHKWLKRGLGIVPCRYPVGYNPFLAYPAYVAIYAKDGTVAVAHGGVEMGQGLNTKVTQVVAKMLNVPMDIIKVKVTNTLTGSNAGVTAASVTQEMLCRSVQDCCKILAERLQPYREKMVDKSWQDIITAAFMGGEDLSAHYLHTEPARFVYDSMGVCAAEVEIDILTGEHRARRVDVCFDCGQSYNPAVDVGQVEGALVMGMGYVLYEQEIHDPHTGKVLSNSTWNYKIPSSMDNPNKMNIQLLKDAPNTLGVISAKALGEPPILLSSAFLSAIRSAINVSRMERGIQGYAELGVPATPEAVMEACEVNINHLILE